MKYNISKEKLKNLYSDKRLSMAKIARRFNCDPTTIQRTMRQYEIKPRTLSEATEKIIIPKKILKNLYYHNKLSTGEIGKLYHCSHATIINKMKFYKLKRRSRLGTRKPVIISKALLKKFYFIKKLSQNQIAQKVKCSRCAIEKLMRKYRMKPRSLSESQMRYLKRDFSGNLIEKSYLIGFRLGDLNVGMAKLQIQVRCSTTVPAQVQLIKKLFSKYTHLDIKKTRFIKKQLVADIRCFLNKSFSFLLPKRDQIESWIIKNDKFFFAFLAGYADAEGCFLIRRYKNMKTPVAGFELQSYDKNIINMIWKKITSLGIQTPKPKISRRKGYKSKIGLINRKDMWRLSIYKKVSLLKFLNFIKLYLKHPKKKNQLSLLKRNVISRLK